MLKTRMQNMYKLPNGQYETVEEVELLHPGEAIFIKAKAGTEIQVTRVFVPSTRKDKTIIKYIPDIPENKE